MREILFRGQTRRRGEKVKMSGEPVESNWVYGGIFPTDNGDRAIIYQREPEIKKYPVYADTVGQYTGLKDKNRNKIFEGDIVRYQDDMNFVVRWSDRRVGFIMAFKHDVFSLADSQHLYEIIGNIYDNPELMEDKDDHFREVAKKEGENDE